MTYFDFGWSLLETREAKLKWEGEIGLSNDPILASYDNNTWNFFISDGLYIGNLRSETKVG